MGINVYPNGAVSLLMPSGKYDRPKRVALCHPNKPHCAKNLCVTCYGSSVRKNNIKKATCHPERPHRAKGLCGNCYSTYLHKNKARKADCHPERPYYGRSLCRSCYTTFAHKNNPKKAGCHPNKPHFGKGMCLQCYNRTKYATDTQFREIVLTRARKYWSLTQQSDKRKIQQKINVIKFKYNLTEAAYNNLYNSQQGRCWICEKQGKSLYDLSRKLKDRLYVDHCHKTSVVRGLLCRNCNSAIGLLEDRVELFHKAIKYIQRYKETPIECQIMNLM
jgi:hypothetical protein